VGGVLFVSPFCALVDESIGLFNWLRRFNTFQFANAYANGEGMKHYVNMVQEPEFAARDKGYTFVSHQQEVGAGYFDDVTTVIQGGSSSVKALTGSTEEEQFH
jgi:isocitrate lyase